jgi:hypothetical protein
MLPMNDSGPQHAFRAANVIIFNCVAQTPGKGHRTIHGTLAQVIYNSTVVTAIEPGLRTRELKKERY